MSGETLTCRELVDFVLAYLEGDLEPAVHSAFEAHLGACPECIDYLDSYRSTVALAAEAWEDACAPDGSVSEEVPEGLVRAILAARRRALE